MAGKVVNSNFLLLSKFGASRQESASKTATSHIRKTLPASVADDTDNDNEKEINHRNNYFSANNNCIFNGTF
jgi:hypothetical protein